MKTSFCIPQHVSQRRPCPASGVLIGVAIATASLWEPQPALSSPASLYEQVETYETTIPATDDPTDIYYPVEPAEAEAVALPVALMLQGAFVDKADYTSFAEQVARYGFVVIVPNHERSVFNPRTQEQTVGFVADQRQVNDVLAFIQDQQSDPNSPLANRIDPDRFALIGHSLGGAVGISAIRGTCPRFLCMGESFQLPPELGAGVFYGTTFEMPPQSGNFPAIDNPVPLALIAGSEDGEANFERVMSTYEQIQNAPRALIRIEGANHYGITNTDSDRAINPPLIEQTEAIATIARWTGQFLRAHLWNDAAAWEYVYSTGDDADERVTVMGETPATRD